MAVFSDTTNSTGLIQICEQELFGDTGFTQISSDSSRLKMFTNYINEANARYTEIAITADGAWAFDDSNQVDLPIATTNLINGQQDYTFAVNFIDILGVEVADSAGIFHGMIQVNERDFSNEAASLTNVFRIPSLPISYMKLANSIFLLPAPNYNYTAGLKIRFQRPHVYFVYNDTTKVAGFNSNHHQYLVDYACWKYASSRSMPSASRFLSEVQRYEQIEIPSFYSSRNKDKVKKFKNVNPVMK